MGANSRHALLLAIAASPAVDAFGRSAGLLKPQYATASRSALTETNMIFKNFPWFRRSGEKSGGAATAARPASKPAFAPMSWPGSKNQEIRNIGTSFSTLPRMKTPETMMTPDEVISSLARGNARYVANSRLSTEGVAALKEKPLAPTAVDAVMVSCARSYAPVEDIFDTQTGSLHSLRVCGNVCQKDDLVVGSIEFALEQYSPAAIVVMGNEKSDVVETAVAQAMRRAGRTDTPDMPHLEAMESADLALLKALAESAEDALNAAPDAPFDSLCRSTATLNVWKSIEVLLTTSKSINERVREGKLQVHGAYYQVSSGRVLMLGEHPTNAELIESPVTAELIRTASEPTVPAEEALAALYAGNKRYTSAMGGQLASYDEALLRGITEGGQNPIAIILGCADSRAPAELFFDARPGDLFILRNAGNTLTTGLGSTLGSAEYAVGPLDTKLIVVTGHTKCGAVTAALQTVLAGAETASVGGSIGKVLDDIVDAAREAIKQLPDAELAEQVTLATKLNVLNAMKKVVENSESIKAGIIKGDVAVHGSVYDIFSGKVEWLGEHPELPKLVGAPLPLFDFKSAPYETPANPSLGRSAGASGALNRLLEGNDRFSKGLSAVDSTTPVQSDPFAIVVGMAEVRVPLERVFDVAPGDLVVQRASGGIAGAPSGTLQASVEYAVARWKPKVLLVLADSDSEIIDAAIDQVSGGVIPTAPMRGVLDRVMVSAMRAQKQVSAGKTITAAGRDIKVHKLTTELNAFYTIEQLLRTKSVREAVRDDGLELHAAVLDERTGKVQVLGEHPQIEGLLDEARY